MAMKVSKRDVAWSRDNLLRDTERYQLNTEPDVFLFKHHLKIDNTNLTPDEVADKVIRVIGLTANEKEEHEYRYGAETGIL